MSRLSRRYLRRVVALTLLGVLPACETPLEPHFDPAVPDVTGLVTPEVRQHLDSNGHFILPAPTSPGIRPIISSAEASDLAIAFLDTFVRDAEAGTSLPPNWFHLRDVLESQHGRPVDWFTISADPRGPYFAETPYSPLPDEFDESSHRHFGPHFLVPVLENKLQVVVVSVAAYATDYSVGVGGRVIRPAEGAGGAFNAVGVLYSHPYRYPIAPEAAVKTVVDSFGSRISSLPRLLQNGLRSSPAGVRWELRLETPVEVRFATSGEAARVDRLYVGQWPSLVDPPSDEGAFLQLRFFVADQNQPTSETLYYRDPDTGERVDVEVPYVEGIPVRFLEVEPAD